MKLSWLGQAGYRIVTDNGTVIIIDPYLSDALHEQKGESYCREVAIKDEFLDSHIDVLILSHEHADHLDFDTLDRLLAANPCAAVLGSLPVLNIMRAHYSLPLEYMLFDPGVEITLNSVRFTSCFASHSGQNPIGIIIEADGKTLCHTGDSMYHKRLLEEYPKAADAFILPINGKGYNMNAFDAVRLCKALRPKAVLPMHWDMFKAYGCDVNEFINSAEREELNILIPAHYDDIEI